MIYVRYSGQRYCFKHLEDFILRRVKKEIRNTKYFPRRGGKVAVGVSGGKDSLSLLYILNEIIEDWRSIEIEAITVDEGIEGYRPTSIALARKVCRELGIEHHIVSIKDLVGMNLDDIVALENSRGHGMYAPCTYCGVFRRHLLNKKAREIRADVLAVGHVLDDMAQSVLINFLRGDIVRMFRLAPHRHINPGMVPRIVPLRLIPQQEIYIYAIYKGIPIHEDECPYVEQAQRNLPLEMITMAEDKIPGTRHAIIRAYEQIIKIGTEGFRHCSVDVVQCKICGNPTSNTKGLCKVCMLIHRIGDLKEH